MEIVYLLMILALCYFWEWYRKKMKYIARINRALNGGAYES